jgi:hypothetical protein
MADQTQPRLTPFHGILTTIAAGVQNGREDPVNIPEVRKRFACYHR